MRNLYVFLFEGPQQLVKFDRHGLIMRTWLGRLGELASCFDFYYFENFGRSVPDRLPESVQHFSGPIRKISPAQIKLEVDALKMRPALGDDLWIAALPKIEVGWLNWETCIYRPSVLPSVVIGYPEIDTVLREIQTALAAGCRLFVGPEDCFHGGSLDNPLPLSIHEMAIIDERLRALSAQHPMTLMVPGTIYWMDAEGGVHNSVLAYADGDNLLSAVADNDKRYWTCPELASARLAGGQPVIGIAPYVEFTWESMAVCVQICADSASPLPRPCDIHLVVANVHGYAELKHRAGGIGVLADRRSASRFQDIYDVHEVHAGTHFRSLSLAWSPRPVFS